MTDFNLRPAVPADQEVIQRLVRTARINPLALDWRRFWVAERPGERILGCAQVKPHRDGSRELASIVVDEPWRRQGIARALIERLQEEAGAPLWLTCRSDLLPFYQQFGFREVSESAAMPRTFNRLKRLARVFHLLSDTDRYLAVMLWDGKEKGGQGDESGEEVP